MQTPNNLKLRQLVLLLLLTLAQLNCSGPLFKVKPVVELPPLPDSTKSTNGGGLTLRVAPLLGDEESQALFESNLPLAGLLPIRAELISDGPAVELKKARFMLRDGDGRQWKLLSAKQAASRIMKANGITAYNPDAKKQFESDLTSYAMDLKTPMTSSERRQGFLFFQTPDKERIASPHGLVLSVEKIPEPLTVAIN